MTMTIDQARSEVAKLKSDLVARLTRFQNDTGLKLRTGIDIRYIETTRLYDKSAHYEIDSVSFDVTL